MTPRRIKTLAERFWAKVDIRELEPGDCWHWHGAADALGYGRIGLGGRGDGVALAHRVAYELCKGPIPVNEETHHGTVVRHTCDNPRCVNPAHLKLGSQVDNIHDAMQRGRTPRGVGHHNAKLTPEDVHAIRQSPLQNTQLAALFGVTPSAIHNIKTRKAWKHIA